VTIVIEGGSSGIDANGVQPLGFAPVKFFDIQIHQAGNWVTVPLPVNWWQQHEWFQVKSSPSTMSLYGSSGPISPAQNDFYVCSEMKQTESTMPSPCPASPYIGSAGFGP
jgi:hypothetical protein